MSGENFMWLSFEDLWKKLFYMSASRKKECFWLLTLRAPKIAASFFFLMKLSKYVLMNQGNSYVSTLINHQPQKKSLDFFLFFARRARTRRAKKDTHLQSSLIFFGLHIFWRNLHQYFIACLYFIKTTINYINSDFWQFFTTFFKNAFFVKNEGHTWKLENHHLKCSHFATKMNFLTS